MDYYPCTTQVPNALFDQWMRTLTLAELKLLLLVIRMTRGWVIPGSGRRKVRDWLSSSRIVALTGLSERAITSATSSLIERGLLVVFDQEGNALAQARQRQGRMRLFYGLAVDNPPVQKSMRRTSEIVAERDPLKLRITKPTYTKPIQPKQGEARADGASRRQYSGPIAGIIDSAIHPMLRTKLAANHGREVAPGGQLRREGNI